MAEGHFATIGSKAVFIPGSRPKGFDSGGVPTGLKIAAGVGVGALAMSGRGRGLAKAVSKRIGTTRAIKRLRPTQVATQVAKPRPVPKQIAGGLSTVSRKGASSKAFIRKQEADALKKLGLKPGATQAQAKKQYFKLSRKYHPDAVGHTRFESQYQNITNAYGVIRTSGRSFSKYAKAA